MKKVNDIAFTIAVLAIAVFLWWKWGPKSCDPIETIITKTDTIQQVPDTVTIYKIPPPEIKYRDTTIYETVYKDRDVDTAAILRNYFAKNHYSDISTDRKNYWIKISDTISQNKIVYRDIQYRDLSPTQIVNNKIIHKQNKVFIGVDMLAGEGYFGVIPTVEIKTKEDYLFGIGYDIANNNFQISAKMKIFER